MNNKEIFQDFLNRFNTQDSRIEFIEKVLEVWNSYTFEKLLQEIREKQIVLKNKSIKLDTFNKLVITDFYKQIKKRRINGKSVEKINNIYEKENLNKFISMSEVFHDTIESSYKYAPILYILGITQKLMDVEQILMKKGNIINNLWGFLGRGYRSFASFLRDYTSKKKFEYFLENLNLSGAYSINILQDSKIDAKEHSDIFFNIKIAKNDLKFRIWLYQSTRRGIINILIRLTGTSRGIISSGYNLWVPIDVFTKDDRVKNIYDWSLYSDSYLKFVIDICFRILKGEISNLLNYNELMEILNFNRKVYNKLNKAEQQVYLRKWSQEQYRLHKKLLSSFFFFFKA